MKEVNDFRTLQQIAIFDHTLFCLKSDVWLQIYQYQKEEEERVLNIMISHE